MLHPPLVQTKLAINQSGDEYEQEADRVAEQVMRMQDPILQRKCAKCNEDEEKILQAKELSEKVQVTQYQDASASIHEVLQSPGEPLDSATRAFMEPRFGHNFSRVRVHTDAKAAESARKVNALAYTVGRNMVFGVGQHAPWSDIGRRLMAHELTHVVQQSYGMRLQPQLSTSQLGQSSEKEAHEVAGKLAFRDDMLIPDINPTVLQVSRKQNAFGESLSSSEEPKRGIGSTLPYREATELIKCIRIMGEKNADYCRQTVLGEPPTVTIPGPISGVSTSGASTSGSGKTARVVRMEGSRNCAYTITYANQREVDCDTAWKQLKGTNPPKPLCGTSLVYDIVSVKAVGSGCPTKLEGLKVSENTKGDHGCTTPDFKWPKGSCTIGSGGKVTGCTDTFTLCGFTSDLKGDCTEFVDQEIEVGGELAEEHEIEFNLKKNDKGCKGTVRRN